MRSYIIHVNGNSKRKEFIESELRKTKLDYEFILDKNIEDLTDEFIGKTFKGEMHEKTGRVSCASKHLVAYENILQNEDEWALILEDDMKFYDEFDNNLNKVLSEIKERKIENSIISLEDSNLKYIKRTERKKNTLLYKRKFGRLAGAYLIDDKAAQSILQFIQKEKVGMPIDWFHNECEKNGIISIYWSDIVLACQGSNSGELPSLLQANKNSKFRKIRFLLEKNYKKMIYFFR